MILRATARLHAANNLANDSKVNLEQALAALNACALEHSIDALESTLSDLAGHVDNTDALEAIRMAVWAAGDDLTTAIRTAANR